MQTRPNLWKKIRKTLLFMGMEPEQFQQIKGAVAEDNRRAIIAWSIGAGLFWILSLAMSLNAEAYAACRMVYIGALAVCAVTLIGARFVAKPSSWLLPALMYLFELSLLAAGIGIAICQPDVRTVTMIAFAIIVPTAMIDSTLPDMILQIIAILAYVLAGREILQPEIYSWGLTNLLIFSAAGLMVGHVINKSRFERYVYAESARRLAEVQTRYAYFDQLTGLRNRRAYVEELEKLAAAPPPELCVVMADLNGLKKANDTLGHEAGDELIVGAADCLRSAFGGIDTIFRIGGDEFRVLLPEPEEKTKRCLEELERVSAQWSGSYVRGVSIACGLASRRESGDLDQLTTRADERMYEKKRQYHRENGL